MSISETPIRVYYHDTDAGGVVYHATFFHYFERGRNEWLREHNLTVTGLAEQHQLIFAVRRASIEYLLPARLDDTLIVQTQIANHTRSTITCAQTLTKDGTPLAKAEICLVCVSTATFKAIPLPDFLKAILV